MNVSDIFTKEMKDAEHFITIQDFILVGSVDEYDTLLEEKISALFGLVLDKRGEN